MTVKSEPKLGTLAPDNAERDAIHIAIAPVEAGEPVSRGQRIALVDGKGYVAITGQGKAIGVVDPFLSVTVNPGQRFWLFLYPSTVTGMRHHWSHPYFTDSGPARDPEGEARRFIEKIADICGKEPSELIEDASRYADHPDFGYTIDNSEDYKSVDYDEWVEFWKHFSVVTGRSVNDLGCPYTCSC